MSYWFWGVIAYLVASVVASVFAWCLCVTAKRSDELIEEMRREEDDTR